LTLLIFGQIFYFYRMLRISARVLSAARHFQSGNCLLADRRARTFLSLIVSGERIRETIKVESKPMRLIESSPRRCSVQFREQNVTASAAAAAIRSN
jgi:hypothetical protein